MLIEHVHTLLGVLGRDADELPRRSDSGERLSLLECELHVRLSNLEKLYLVGRTRCGHGRKIQTFIRRALTFTHEHLLHGCLIGEAQGRMTD